MEPEFELCNVYFKSHWVEVLIPFIVKAIQAAFDENATIFVVLNDALADLFDRELNVIPIVFSQKELRDPNGVDLVRRRIKIESDPNGKAAKAKAQLLLEKLSVTNPDLIICLGHRGAIQTAFPDVSLRYLEYSMFSRRIWPENWSLDPYFSINTGILDAKIDGHWIKKLIAQQESVIDPSPEMIKGTELILGCYQEKVSALYKHDNYQALKQEVGKYQRCVLTAMQFQDYALDAYMRKRMDINYVIELLDIMPSDHLLLVMPHHMQPDVTDENKDYLTKRYGNVIFPRVDYGIGSSDYLGPLIDCMVVGTSKAAGTSLLWNVPLIVDSNAEWFSSLASSRDIHSVLGKSSSGSGFSHEKRMRLLSWIMFRGSVFPYQMNDPDWMKNFVKLALTIEPDPNTLLPEVDVEKHIEEWLKFGDAV